ncbi:MAG: tripartite tricarboxylate transporter substrate binding protein [Burkholderiales bacterium]|nr:tripartite tricarboxylate transporter substrate binding protein [Burkholderiales bacterium]
MFVAAFLLGGFTSLSLAQNFPARPIRMIIGFPPGGGTDILGRIFSPKFGENLGQQIVVDNRGGANGLVGTDLAAKAPADGYTIFLGTAGNLTVNPSLYKTPFDMSRDFAPITQVANTWLILVANPSFPAKSVKDVVALAKGRPGGINYSSSGTGSLLNLGGELLGMLTQIKLVHVPYKGSAPSLTALVGGEVPLSVDTILLTQQFIKAGKVRPIAVLGGKRAPMLPDVPSVSETVPGYDVTNWFGLVIPGATPAAIRARVHSAVVKALASQDVKEKLLQQGAEPVGNSSEEFGKFMKAETERWARVIREAKIKVD